jgi:hypothetical protein
MRKFFADDLGETRGASPPVSVDDGQFEEPTRRENPTFQCLNAAHRRRRGLE